jgi:hypothetical protein
MSEAKLRPFRWLGRGVLHINHPDGSTVVVPPDGPASIVRKPENLAVLGADFIDQIIKDGRAEGLNIVDGIMEAIKPSAGTMTPEELAQAQQIADDSRKDSKVLEKKAKDQKAAGISGTSAPEGTPSALPSTAAGPRK